MERNDSNDSNPWGAEPSYAQRVSSYHAEQAQGYEQQMQDALASPPPSQPNGLPEPASASTHGALQADEVAQDNEYNDDDDDDQFVYDGVETTAQLSTSMPDDSNVSSMNSDTYSAKLKDILGSDDEGDDEDAAPILDAEPQAPTSPTTQKGDLPSTDVDVASNATPRYANDAPSDDGSSFRYPAPLPHDVSFDTRSASSSQPQQPRQRIPSHASSSRIFTPRSTSGTGLSLLRQSNTISASTPQRPMAYPSLSRLRASVGRTSSASLALPKHLAAESGRSSAEAPGSPASTSSVRKVRSPLPFEFTANGLNAAAQSSRDDDASQSAMAESSITQRSRQSSFSTTVSTTNGGHNKRRRARVSFPYGPTLNGAALPTAESATSLLSDRASSSSARHLGHTAVLGGGEQGDEAEPVTSLKETFSNERDELSRDFVKWSALRSIVINAKSSPEAPDPMPTVLAVAGGLIAVGTRGGKTIVCDFAQEPIASCGHDGRGHGDAVTALAFSSDHSFLGVGHASGNIFLYELSNPGRAARHVAPVPLASVKAGKREGHLSGSAIVHIGFIGLRHTAIVTADNKGLAFYHALGKILGVSSNDTLRLLGKYPQYEHEDELGLSDGKKRNTIFQLSPLPLGPRPHAADETTFVAMITPTKMVLVGLKPSPRTWYRKVNRPSGVTPATEKLDALIRSAEETMQEPGCLAWYPASTETDGQRRRKTNPILAFSFGSKLHLVRLVVRKVQQRPDPRMTRDPSMQPPNTVTEEVDPVELTGEDGIEEPDHIVALQWFSPDLLLLTTRSGLALFDCRAGKVTERMSGGSAAAVLAKTIEQRYYDAVLLGKPFDPHAEPQDESMDSIDTNQTRSWAINHSVRISKSRSFFLTSNDLVVGTLLSWADRLLLYVSQGNFLAAIELATLFHQGKFLGSAVGLPSDPHERTRIVADKLRELMSASADYAFSPERLTDSTHVTPDGRGVDRTSLFQGLARVCARACLSLGDLDFLFDTLYDKYEDNGIEAIFVGQMEDFIVSGELRTLPIPVVQRLVAFRRDRQEYEQAEKIIWHVDPKSLDLDQALSLCLDRRLYDALIYVFNAALDDYVSPIIEMLHPLRRVIERRCEQQQQLDTADLDDPYAHIRISEAGAAATTDPADEVSEWEREERDLEDGYRVFSYLSVILTGNQYPSQEPFKQDEQASKAKAAIYSFVFSGSCTLWPPGPGGKLVLYGLDNHQSSEAASGTANNDGEHEPIYPYLRLLLEFDAEAFLDVLDLAFEDGFLDDEDVVGKRISRQLIVDVLSELTSAHTSDGQMLRLAGHSNDPQERTVERRPHHGRSPTLPLVARIFVHIFVARNAPKYPQFIHLSQHNVELLLRSLALPTEGSDEDDVEVLESTHEDRELAAECLLSHYKPRFDDAWLDVFERASFHRILRSAFRQEKKWDRLLGMYLREHLQADLPAAVDAIEDDAQKNSGKDAFAHFEETLFNAARKDTPDREQLASRLHEQLSDHIIDLLDLDPLKTASLLDRFFPKQHEAVLQRLAQLDEKRLLLYLQCFFEPLQVSKAAQESAVQRQPEQEQGNEDDLGWTSVAKAPVSATYNADVGRSDPDHLDTKERQAYIDLLCRYDPESVVRNLDARGASYFDLQRLVKSGRSSDVAIDGSRVARNSDAVLWALDRMGRSKEAFEELDTACARTADSLVFIASSTDQPLVAAEELLGDVRRCVYVAVRLCIERANAFGGSHDSDDEDGAVVKPEQPTERLDTDEVWYRLLRSLVRLVHDVAHLDGAKAESEKTQTDERPKQLLNGVRDIVQDTLNDLISSTAAEAVSFPALFRRLTGSGSEGKTTGRDEAGVAENYAEIRSVLDGMLSAYHLRSELLGITNKLFDRDTYHQFRRLHAQRRHGWRPAGGSSTRCTGCDMILVGPKRGTLANNAAVNGSTSRETATTQAVDVDDLRRKAFQQSRASSFSGSPTLRRTSSSMLTPSTTLLQHHHRRAKSPYDEKAAPLASPRIDKGKGVVRSASSEYFQANGDGGGGGVAGEEAAFGEVDGYFEGFEGRRPTWNVNGMANSMMRSNSGISLWINDEPQRDQEQSNGIEEADEGEGLGEEEDGDGTLTPSHFGLGVQMGQQQNGWAHEGGDSSFDVTMDSSLDEAESKEGERIVVQKSGLMYHESCWKRAHPESSVGL